MPPALRAIEPGWADFLAAAGRCYRTVQPDAWDARRYLPALRDFAELSWIEAAAAAGGEPPIIR